jgi:hypothetical protein
MKNSQESQEEEPEEKNHYGYDYRATRIQLIPGGWRDVFTGEEFVVNPHLHLALT